MVVKRKKKRRLKNPFEKRIYNRLRRARAKFKYESERIPYVLAGHYTPDFVLDTVHGRVYLECKGYFRREDKRKLAAIKRQHPEMDLRILFYASSKTNIKWAEKNGLKYAVSKLPKEWLDGL
jgi:predicted nuclease of restriction endonuclease-like RecB superfamily